LGESRKSLQLDRETNKKEDDVGEERKGEERNKNSKERKRSVFRSQEKNNPISRKPKSKKREDAERRGGSHPGKNLDRREKGGMGGLSTRSSLLHLDKVLPRKRIDSRKNYLCTIRRFERGS